MQRLRGRAPTLLIPGGPIVFPNPEDADDEGLLAVGGDLSPGRLLAAYEQGIFPWYDEGVPPLWWSPNPRMVIEAGRIHISRSLRRVLTRERFRMTWNLAFDSVMRECGDRRAGTWILPEMIDAYGELHRLGHAHSIEVWQDGVLVGGLYGVQRGALFAAESMFHRRTDASKVALVHAATSVFLAGVTLFDVQLWTPHLESMGAAEIPRSEYLRRVRHAIARRVDLSQLELRWEPPPIAS
jgi:leucyl/phenylalanyl-tRNA---protein transferase